MNLSGTLIIPRLKIMCFECTSVFFEIVTWGLEVIIPIRMPNPITWKSLFSLFKLLNGIRIRALASLECHTMRI